MPVTGARIRHARAQFDARSSLPFWRRWDTTVEVPALVALAAYPIVIGARVIVWAGAVPLAAARNYLSWSAPGTGDIPRDRPFVLVLRTFGHDGNLLLPPALDSRDTFPRAVTLEQVVGEIVAGAGLSAVGFADHDLSHVPDGIRYHRTDHEDWRAQFEQLVAAAAAIIVMPTPGQRLGDNFRSELEHLRENGYAGKTIVVGPPNLDAELRRATHETYSRLGWPAVHHVYLVAHQAPDGRTTVYPSYGDEDPDQAERYRLTIEAALTSVLGRSERPLEHGRPAD